MVVYIAANNIRQIKELYVVAFFLGPCVIGRMACGFLLLMELVPRKYQTWVGTGVMIIEGLGQIIWTIYFAFISRNAFYFIYFAAALTLIALVGTLYIVESPRYLFGIEKFEECKKVLCTIAARNGIHDY